MHQCQVGNRDVLVSDLVIARPNPSDERFHGWVLQLIDRSTGSDRIQPHQNFARPHRGPVGVIMPWPVPASCLALPVLFLDSVRSIIDASAYILPYPNLLSACGKKIALSAIPYIPFPLDLNIGSVPHTGTWSWQFVIRSPVFVRIDLRP